MGACEPVSIYSRQEVLPSTVQADQYDHCVCMFGLLWQGATVLDFAYHVHTDVGNHMIGAKVNGRYVMASHQLANAEIIDILTYDGPLTKNLVARHQVRAAHSSTCHGAWPMTMSVHHGV